MRLEPFVLRAYNLVYTADEKKLLSIGDDDDVCHMVRSIHADVAAADCSGARIECDPCNAVKVLRFVLCELIANSYSTSQSTSQGSGLLHAFGNSWQQAQISSDRTRQVLRTMRPLRATSAFAEMVQVCVALKWSFAVLQLMY